MADLHVHEMWIEAAPPQLQVMEMWVTADEPVMPDPELHVLDMWIVSGPAPPIGPGGVWMNIPGQGPVKHRVRYYRGGQWV